MLGQFWWKSRVVIINPIHVNYEDKQSIVYFIKNRINYIWWHFLDDSTIHTDDNFVLMIIHEENYG